MMIRDCCHTPAIARAAHADWCALGRKKIMAIDPAKLEEALRQSEWMPSIRAPAMSEEDFRIICRAAYAHLTTLPRTKRKRTPSPRTS